MLFAPGECGLTKVGRFWHLSRDGDDEARSLFDRHYSRRKYSDGRKPKLFVGPGEKMVLITTCGRGLFVWRKFISADDQEGINCAVFRNETKEKSSLMILDAEKVAMNRWPGEGRFYTYVNPKAIRSTNPGCCFKKAGWRRYGLTKSGLVILEKRLLK
jgi:hypothetical protein